MAKKENDKRDYHQEVTNDVLRSFETARNSNWEKPWFPVQRVSPFNALTKRNYSGCNHISLGLAGFSDPQWLTKPQMDEYARIHKLDLQIKKGSKARTVFKAFAKEYTEDASGKPLEKPYTSVFMIRAGAAFNAEQIEGMPLYQHKTREFNPIFAGEELLNALKERDSLRIVDTNAEAYYSPGEDYIGLPPRNTFLNDEVFYDTACHETSHWTGHPSRLNRSQIGKYGTPAYANEEFVAEMSSCFLTAQLGIPHNQKRHESFLDYMNNWQRALQADKNLIFKASNAASRACNFQMEHLREYLYDLNMRHIALEEQNNLLESIGVPERILKQIQNQEAEEELQGRQEESAEPIQSPTIDEALAVQAPIPVVMTPTRRQSQSRGMRM